MSLRGENRQIEKRHRPNDIAKSHSCQKIHAWFVIIYSYLIVRKYKPSPCVAQVNLHFTVSDSKTVWDYVPSVKNTYTTWRCIRVKTFTQKHFISLESAKKWIWHPAWSTYVRNWLTMLMYKTLKLNLYLQRLVTTDETKTLKAAQTCGLWNHICPELRIMTRRK